MPASAPLAVVRFHQMPRMSAGKLPAAAIDKRHGGEREAVVEPVQREPGGKTGRENQGNARHDQLPADRRPAVEDAAVEIVAHRIGDRDEERVGRRKRCGNRAGGDQRRRHIGQVRHPRQRQRHRVARHRDAVDRRPAADHGADRLQRVDGDGVDAADADEAEPAEGEEPVGDIVRARPDHVVEDGKPGEGGIGRRREQHGEDDDQRPSGGAARVVRPLRRRAPHQHMGERCDARGKTKDDAEKIDRVDAAEGQEPARRADQRRRPGGRVAGDLLERVAVGELRQRQAIVARREDRHRRQDREEDHDRLRPGDQRHAAHAAEERRQEHHDEGRRDRVLEGHAERHARHQPGGGERRREREEAGGEQHHHPGKPISGPPKRMAKKSGRVSAPDFRK